MQLETLNVNLNGSLFLLPIVSSWIIMMQRFDGTLNFNRKWIDYRNGFGEIGRGEFWLGNEKVHAVIAQPGLVYQLRIEVSKSTVYTNTCSFRSSAPTECFCPGPLSLTLGPASRPGSQTSF